MAYYKYSSNTGELLEISDFQLVPDGDHVVSANEVSRSDLEKYYEWNSYSLAFLEKTRRTVAKKDFLKRITPSEYAAIKTEIATNGILDYHWQMIMLSDLVDLDDADTTTAFNTIESLNIISSARKTEILA